MLHQPSSTFEPSQPASTPAQPFDAKRYLERAKALGIMLFPTISASGRHLYGLTGFPGHDYSNANRKLAFEFAEQEEASPDSSTAIFDALVEDFGVDLADPVFNDKVDRICRARCETHTDGDKRLIKLCKLAQGALSRDLAATDLQCELTERMEKVALERPRHVLPDGSWFIEMRSAAEMREKLPEMRAIDSPSVIKAYRERIARVVAYEKERDRIRREIGLAQADAAVERAAERSMSAVADVAELPAMTMIGLAHKAAILAAWDRAGYGLSCTDGERLAHSIADDARMLGTGGNYRPGRSGPATAARAVRHEPPAQPTAH